MLSWKSNDRRRVSVSLILYRIIILLTLILSIFAPEAYKFLVVNQAHETLGQAYPVPAAPFSGGSPEEDRVARLKTSCKAYRPHVDLNDLCDALLHSLPPDGGAL
jgi:hypothetical protein